MRYSVWDGSDYSYYEAPGSLRDGVFAPTPTIRTSRRLGVTPEEAAARLPAGAKRVGGGPYPMGTIATRNGGSTLGFLDTPGELAKLAFYGSVAYLIYYFTTVGGSRKRA
jgi:hypothetical protein